MSKRKVALTEMEASMVLSNWGRSVGLSVWITDILPREKATALVTAWGGEASTTSNFLASIIEVLP